MMNFRDKEIQHHGESSKQQVGDSTKVMVGASSSSRQWSSGFKNPRIVRVSRTFGGKDRHSKVCTIKGLRDRRIRLSVPTAIQLYDLQDRLGLSQPSKVIDWLLDSTKHDIDKLPPLPIIPGTFPTFHQATYGSQGYRAPQSSPYTPFLDANLLPLRKEGININSDHQGVEVDDREQSLVAKLKYWDSSMVSRLKQKGVDHDRGGVGESPNSQVSAQNFFPIASSSNASMLPPPSLLSTNPMLNYWEPSTLSLTQFGGLGSSSQSDHHQGAQGNSTNVPSSLSLSSGSQLFLYPSMTNPSYLPPQNTLLNSHNHQVESDLRNQFNRSHLLSNFHSSSDLHNSSRLDLKPFPFSMNHHPDHLHQNHDERHQDKRN